MENEIDILKMIATVLIGMMLIIPIGQVNADEGSPEENGINFEVHHFISAEDHPDILDNTSVDNIAIITLTGEENITISDIEIVITNDRKNFLEMNIVGDGIWHIGEQITIREIFPDQVEISCYNIRICTSDGLR